MNLLIPEDNLVFSSSDDSDDDYEINPRRVYTLRMKIDHFNRWDEINFYQRFRLNKNTVVQVLQHIENQLSITRNRSRALSPMGRLLLTLRFYATGSILQASGDFSGVSISTASRIIKKVSMSIASLSLHFIRMPRNREEIRKSHLKFFNMHEFPRVIGCIDCTHIRIQSPGGDNAEYFRNRKGYFSLNVQAICDSNMKFLDIVARWPGSSHDSTIFTHSNIHNRFETNEFGNSCLLGDSGYALSKYLLTPLLNPITAAEINYNESQISTRNIIERVFGVWKRRFPTLSLGMRLKMTTIQDIIVATAVLHNIAVDDAAMDPEIAEEENINHESEESDDEDQELHQNLTGAGVRNALIIGHFTR